MHEDEYCDKNPFYHFHYNYYQCKEIQCNIQLLNDLKLYVNT